MKAWFKKKEAWSILGLVALAVGFGVARQIEHSRRIATAQQLAQTIQAKQLVEAKLSAEERRSQKLAEALEVKTKEVDQVVRRLEAEANAVELLQGRLAQMESQIGQLQAELVLAVRAREELAQVAQARPGAAPAELEKIRIVVGPLQPEAIEGRVIQVNTKWQFVVVDLGWNALSIGDVLGVYRDGELIAKVQVERIQEQLAAARILPEYQGAEIARNDRVVAL